jgi:uncharacterized protein (TIGR02594 family)
MEEPVWMTVARGLVGTKEVPGTGNNRTILQWARALEMQKTYNADSIPWCGLFVAYCVAEAGLEPVEAPLWARNWAKWGEETKPVFGSILVFVRDRGGHVGFAVSQDADTFHVLGGNQSDAVNVTRIAKNRLIGCRWPMKERPNSFPNQALPTVKFDGKISRNEA